MLKRRAFLTGVATAAAAAVSGLVLPRSPAARLGRADQAGRVAWLAANTAPLRTLDMADDDFADLEPFRKAVGDARVVMLGEATHGDGTALVAKSRLIRFLHERMGFDVLAFESNLYYMRKVWERIRAGEPVRQAVTRGMYGMWSGSRQVQPLIDYIGAHAHGSRPLELAGVDCQLLAPAVADNLADDLASFLAARGIDVAAIAAWPGFRAVIDTLAEGTVPAQAALSPIDTVMHRLVAMNEPGAAFWRQVLRSTKAWAEELSAIKRPGGQTSPLAFNVRDAAMADNLLWLRNANPSRKIIVWAANFHVCHMPTYGFIGTGNGQKTMGTHIASALGDAAHCVGMTCYDGRRSFVAEKYRELAPAPAGSLEGLWEATGQRTSLLDVRHAPASGEWLRERFSSRICSDTGEMQDDAWGRMFDSVLFLRTMEPNVYSGESV
jgi:erythromycin esterase